MRLLSYLNHANMGNYEEAIAELSRSTMTPTPNIIATRRQGRHKYGFGLNFEQEITPHVGVFGRLGWSDGRNESFAYTEDDRTLELGAFAMGKPWHRATIAPASPSSPTESSPRTSNILRSAASDSSSATAA